MGDDSAHLHMQSVVHETAAETFSFITLCSRTLQCRTQVKTSTQLSEQDKVLESNQVFFPLFSLTLKPQVNSACRAEADSVKLGNVDNV